MNRSSRVYVAGHRGLVGSACVRALAAAGYDNLLLPGRELDLRRQEAVEAFFASNRPEIVLLAAARVGGIMANASRPADFIGENLQIQTNVIDAAYRHGCRKLLFFGSSCIYPRLAEQPIREEYLLTGPLEATNEWYAIAKIAGLKMCQAYRRQHGFDAIALMPTNLYGPGDNFDPLESHVLPALLRRMHEAKHLQQPSVVVWGSGEPLREFLHVDDLAAATLFLLENYSAEEPINVGTGSEVTIRELAGILRRIVGYQGTIEFDRSKPDGAPRKRLDVTAMTRLGWRARILLEDGIRSTYEWYLEHAAPEAPSA
jgi:GDP-L-fucose synthase